MVQGTGKTPDVEEGGNAADFEDAKHDSDEKRPISENGKAAEADLDEADLKKKESEKTGVSV